MSWKKDKDGHLELSDGNPVWVHADGKEAPFDAEATLKNIDSISRELNALKDSDTKNKKTLGLLEGIEDPAKWMEEAKKALQTVADLKDGDLVKAKDAATLKEQLSAQFQAEKKSLEDALAKAKGEAQKAIEGKDRHIFDLAVKSAITGSQFLQDKTILGADVASMIFGQHFKVEEVDGRPVPVAYRDGQPIMSKTRPGSRASVDEAIAELWEQYPDRQRYAKPLPGGSGAPGGMGGEGNTGDVILTRDQARDVATYRSAQEQASKGGGKVIIK